MGRIKLKKLLVTMVLLMLVSAISSSVSAEESCWNITPLTDDSKYDRDPQIWGSNVVWSGYNGRDYDIFLYNGTETIQLTDSGNNRFPQIWESNVVWSGYNGGDNEIFLYNGTETIQLSDSGWGRNFDPQIWGSNVVWSGYGYDGNHSELYLYNGSETIQLTDYGGIVYKPQIWGSNVVWRGKQNSGSSYYEIYLYNGTETIQLSDSNGSAYPQIWGSNVVWCSYDGNDNEIYLYNGTETIQLTDNSWNDYNPQVWGSNVVWCVRNGGDNEIFLYNGTETIQLSDNIGRNFNPQIWGSNVVWRCLDGNDNEIFLYNGTEIIQLTDNGGDNYGPQIWGSTAVWYGPNGNHVDIFKASVCTIEVAVDIKPGSCPNPVNVKSKGVLPVAILGTEEFEVSTIDPASIFLNGVPTIRSSYEDVAGPVANPNECECTTGGPDGFGDLTVKFYTQQIVGTLGQVNTGDILTLPLTGVLNDGTGIEGADCVVIVGRHKPINKADINEDGVVNTVDIAIVAENWLQSSIVEE